MKEGTKENSRFRVQRNSKEDSKEDLATSSTKMAASLSRLTQIQDPKIKKDLQDLVTELLRQNPRAETYLPIMKRLGISSGQDPLACMSKVLEALL